MENQKNRNTIQEYQEDLNDLIKELTIGKLQFFFESKNSSLGQILIGCDNSIYGRAEKDVLIGKKKIMEELLNVFGKLKKIQVKQLKSRIKGLTLPIKTILREGIIGIYSDISQLKQKYILKPESSQFVSFLEKTISFLQPLLRDYFIFRQIEKNDHRLTNYSSLKVILSETKIVNSSCQSLTSINSINETHSIKEMISDRILKEIAKNIELKSIRELIHEQLEQNQQSEVEETCRICKNTFKLKVLEKHVQYCSKIQAYNSRREELIESQLMTIEKIKQQIFQLSQKQNNFNSEEFKIYKKIIDQFQEAPTKLHRRNSLHGTKRRKKIVKRLSIEIQEYLRQNKKNSLLVQFNHLAKERQNVQKKIESLQNNYLHYKKGNEDSSLSQLSSKSKKNSTQSFKTSKAVSIKTKKSLFARKQQSSSSHSDSKLDQFRSEVKRFQSIKAHMDEIIDDSDSDFDQKAKLHKSLSNFVKRQEEKRNQISTEDFQIVKFLGKGAFGKVYMVRRKKTRDIYALKVIKIQQNWDQKQLSSIKNEHQILSQIAGQYLVKAPFSFTEGSAHFFVLQYMPGGDLGKVIEDQVYLNIEQAQFYLAQIVLAIERLHEMGIIHRDLKPENLIFDEDGHLKLTDFGLSEIRINDKIRRARKLNSTMEQKEKQKEVSLEQCPDEKRQKLKSVLVQTKKKAKIIGTPDYIAPQIISGESLDNLSIDWWSLGVIAYEMMVGCRPFCADTIEDVIRNIEEFNIEWPEVGEGDDKIDEVADSFIRSLLNQNYEERLGGKSINEIKSHPFFKGINWEEIKQMKPPLIPVMDRKENYEYAEQIPELRAQIKSAICNYQAKSSFKLENFVRYDILVEETLNSADKKIQKREVKIKKLRSIASNFQNSSKESNQGSKEALFDEIEKCWKNFNND